MLITRGMAASGVAAGAAGAAPAAEAALAPAPAVELLRALRCT
jgi:hypothetical protein